MSEFKEQETRERLLKALKELGWDTTMITGHGESWAGIFFSKDSGQLDKLLDFMVNQEREIHTLAVTLVRNATPIKSPPGDGGRVG